MAFRATLSKWLLGGLFALVLLFVFDSLIILLAKATYKSKKCISTGFASILATQRALQRAAKLVRQVLMSG
jgi:hypothetical protein